MHRLSRWPAWRRLATLSALLGLVTQIVVAATHHHERVSALTSAAIAQDATRSGDDLNAPTPAVPDADGEACAICLAVSLGAMALVPASILLALVIAAQATPRPATRPVCDKRWRSFASRAPPVQLPAHA